MLAQGVLEQAAWSASGRSTIKLNRLPRLIAGGAAHIVGVEFKLVETITAGGAGVDTLGTYMVRAIDELKLTDSLGIEVIRIKGHQVRTLLKALTGRNGGGHADPADVAAAGGAGNSRTVRFFVPFVGEGGPVPNGVRGFRKWSDLIQPVDRFIGENAELVISWGPAACFNAGTLTAATLTVTPFMLPMTEMVQGADLRLSYQTQGAGQRFDATLRGSKLLAALMTNPDLDHSDYTQLDMRDSLLVRADPVERIAAFNAMSLHDATEYLSLTAPEFLPIVFPYPGQGLTKVLGFKSPAQLQLEVTTAHATDQWMALAEIHDRAQLVENLRGSGVGDYRRAMASTVKYANKNEATTGSKKRATMARLGAAKVIRGSAV
jgi:hypothetical protein